MAQKIVGLDIGQHAVKAVVLESTYRGWELIGFHEMKTSGAYVTTEAMIRPRLEDVGVEPEPSETTDEAAAENGETPAAASEKPLDPRREQLRAVVGHFLRQYNKDWDTLFTAISGDHISVKILSLPYSNPRQIEQTITFALEDLVPFPLDGKIVDYQILSKDEKSTRILAGLLDYTHLRNYLDDLKAAGKEPKAVTLDAVALGGLFAELATAEQRQGLKALIDIGHRKTIITLLKGGGVVFARIIPFGGQDFTRAAAEALDIDFETAERTKHLEGYVRTEGGPAPLAARPSLAEPLERAAHELARQIKITLQSHVANTREGVEAVFLAGGGSKLANLPAFLAEALEVPVSPFLYLRPEFSKLAGYEDVEPEMAAGLGIALMGVSGSRFKRLNFRKGDFAFKGDFEQWKGRISQLTLNMAFVVLFLLANIASQFRVLGAEEAKMEEQIAAACKTILGKDVADAKVCVSQMMEVIEQKGAGSSKLRPDVSTLTLYDELVARMTADSMVVDVSEMELTDKKIKIKGEVDDIPTVGKIVENLKGYKCFSNIDQGPTRKNVKGDRIQFSLGIAIDCTGGKRGETRETAKEESRGEDRTEN
ncbi:MAG: hypothetical protein C4523_15650 [Myxococcales bacterium]|nr:MAG: hypothetical protein C4523_15650 [Myxococcales bacterium]